LTGLFSKLRIGEKIGLSTGLVGVLFLAVIWHYQNSLESTIADYRRLGDTYGAREILAFEIQGELSGARRAEADFLLSRDESHVTELERAGARLMDATARLAQVDAESRRTAAEIDTLIQVYLERFRAIAEAWRTKGLDHNSGLQGAFRDRVHDLEDRAGNFKAGRLYLQLLQIRRGEKDLGLRREPLYREKVEHLIEGFRALIAASELTPEVKSVLTREISVYAETFEPYADRVLADGETAGGKGPFRQAAHRIEDVLIAHYVPDLEANILQLRRREKDYLLRGDKTYVRMVGDIAGTIRAQIGDSGIAEDDKTMLADLLAAYEKDFLALVEQNDLIDHVDREMREAADRITPLVRRNLDQATSAMDRMEAAIAESSEETKRINLIIVVAAAALGVFLATVITVRIVRPVRQMAGLLDRLTHESPSERMATVPGARDEINAMAESLNTMADHRANFVAWWKASMDEAIALRDLNEATSGDQRDESVLELRRAALEKLRQVNAIRAQLAEQNQRLVEAARRLSSDRGASATDSAAQALERSARQISSLLDVLSRDAAS
jgi:methyl-accepting chemotaxis protein